METPVFGLIPKKIHDQARAMDIIDAMKRYICADETIPTEWIDELKYMYGELE